MNKFSEKRMKLVVLCFLSQLIFAAACSRESSRSSAPANTSPTSSLRAKVRSSADVVKVNAADASVQAGGNIDTEVTLSISPGFHVNANPATFSYLIATEITAGNVEGIAAGKPDYPAPVKKKFQFADQPLAVYETEAPIKLNLRAEKNAATGPRSLPITVTVQACDEEQCFPPATIKSAVPVTVK
jgi:DsbC/DsbD-like thiol-disulfide interchange protein